MKPGLRKMSFQRFAITPRWTLPAVLGLGMAFGSHWIASIRSAPPKANTTKEIIPILVLKPGETKQFLLSTHCAVGVTRSGGFAIAEMQDGKAVEGTKVGFGAAACYERNGIKLSIPGFVEAEAFASSKPFDTLGPLGIQVFMVTVTASSHAEPGLMDIHLVDRTCSGHCSTDLRVLVAAE